MFLMSAQIILVDHPLGAVSPPQQNAGREGRTALCRRKDSWAVWQQPGQGSGPRGRVQTQLYLPLPGCMTQGQSLSLPVPRFPRLPEWSTGSTGSTGRTTGLRSPPGSRVSVLGLAQPGPMPCAAPAPVHSLTALGHPWGPTVCRRTLHSELEAQWELHTHSSTLEEQTFQNFLA